MFLRPWRQFHATECLPHTRGGVSNAATRLAYLCESSPHTWGCFVIVSSLERTDSVFPTHVGVFPPESKFPLGCWGLPHTRGGVSPFGHLARTRGESSPHTWGCFSRQQAHACRWSVFPTHVGVFPPQYPSPDPAKCLPHTRGGVSQCYHADRPPARSSPHTWGCFYLVHTRSGFYPVFPTHVGVFPNRLTTSHAEVSLPHTRGGVSAWRVVARERNGSSPHTWGCFFPAGGRSGI